VFERTKGRTTKATKDAKRNAQRNQPQMDLDKQMIFVPHFRVFRVFRGSLLVGATASEPIVAGNKDSQELLSLFLIVERAEDLSKLSEVIECPHRFIFASD